MGRDYVAWRCRLAEDFDAPHPSWSRTIPVTGERSGVRWSSTRQSVTDGGRKMTPTQFCGEVGDPGPGEGNSFISIVRTSGGPLEILHGFGPSTSANLYKVFVNIRNTSSTVTVNNILYRRLMDWDVPPVVFHEWVEIHVKGATSLI